MKIILLLGVGILLLSSCATTRTKAYQPQPLPLLQQIPVSELEPTPVEQPRGDLTLVQSLTLALQRNPQLAAFSLEIRAREAATLQAALLSNPELVVEVENFAGSGSLSAFKSTETTVSIGQLIELSGKRHKRAKVAALESDLAAWNYESKRLDVFVQVVTAFNNVLAAQEQVKLDREVLALTEKFKTNIAHRVQAGRISPAELSRADVEIANVRIALQRSQKILASARQELAATWGAGQITFKRVVGNLDHLAPLPDLNKLFRLLNQNPDLARWQTVKKHRQAVHDLAKAEVIPDPVLSVGWRRFNDRGDHAFVAGLTIPLPVFNRNQGRVQESIIRLKQADWRERSGRIGLQAILNRKYQMLMAAHQSLQSLKEEIIPRAQEAFDTINQGYRQGKFGFLDVLDARRTLFSSRQAYLQNLKDYQQLRSQIERLIGQSLDSVK